MFLPGVIPLSLRDAVYKENCSGNADKNIKNIQLKPNCPGQQSGYSAQANKYGAKYLYFESAYRHGLYQEAKDKGLIVPHQASNVHDCRRKQNDAAGIFDCGNAQACLAFFYKQNKGD